MSTSESNQKYQIEAALKDFADQPLADAASTLFETLGYTSKKRLRLSPNNREQFLATFAQGKTLNDKLALSDDWKSVDFLFQLTDDEIQSTGGQQLLFESKSQYNDSVMESYLFLALELKGSRYTRTALSGVTRELNKFFAMPALVIYKHGDTISFAIIRRRLNKRDDSLDVIERKVTLIKDIRFVDPLRAHIEILNDLSFSSLYEEYFFHNFVGLHLAWEKRLDTYQLNAWFYRDVANWYFWALKHEDIRFPRSVSSIQDDVEREKQQSIFLIRLLTRLIFCWFLQEKRLVPRDLFRRRVPEEMLVDFKPRSDTYYRAFLQNLFFGTLNQEIDKRRFRKKNPSGRDPDHGITNLYRYEDYFLSGKAKNFVEMLKRIPFVNGGLFDCLDTVFKKEENRPDIRLDDFSEETKSDLFLPNELFFCEEHPEDLSDAYNDSRRSKERVRGLIDILGRYKFTVEENTPLEEEIALDPEMLGKVFENLLASYNEDTKSTARKAFGAFYTPREIVSYMVDESLIVYLKNALAGRRISKSKTKNANQDKVARPEGGERIRTLFSVSAKPEDVFTPTEIEDLIVAIDHVKVLDPACGSGAFPMGVLHRLVDLLAKLDPNNKRWKERQLAKVRYDQKLAERMQDEEVRETTLQEVAAREVDIKRSFDNRFHAIDFARKLYLIENCIYGVDILPIACQIAKLRFFIALIVDQNLDSDDKNLGFRPLPNLETKIVAANSLIPIEKPQHQMELLDMLVRPLRQELEQVRHDHFNARTPDRKAKCRKRDAELRAKIADLLSQNGMPADQAKALADWDPYDQNHHASFFDSEWMFGLPVGKVRITDKSPSTLLGNLALINDAEGQMELAARGVEIESGFDIVVGNPPYGVKFDSLRKTMLSSLYPPAKKVPDSYCFFVLRSMAMLKPAGVLSFIVPNTFCDLENGDNFRQHILKNHTLNAIWQSGWAFAASVVDTLVFVLSKQPADANATVQITVDDGQYVRRIVEFLSSELAKIDYRNHPKVTVLLKKVLKAGTPLSAMAIVKAGVKMYEKKQGDPPQTKKTVDERPFSVEGNCPKGWRPLYRGADIERYRLPAPHEFVKYGPWLAAPRNPELFVGPKILMRRTDDRLRSVLDPTDAVCVNSCHVIKLKQGVESSLTVAYVLGCLNSHVLQWSFEKCNPQMVEKTFAEIKVVYVERLPIPQSTFAQRSVIQLLVEDILWLNSQDEVISGGNPRDTLMISYWDQLINGLVYELFFPDELHAAQIHLFDLMTHEKLPAIDSTPESKRLAHLRRDFERLYEHNHPIRAALHALRSLETIRIIEGE